jgi:cytochrome c-type biogenesis protein CcmH
MTIFYLAAALMLIAGYLFFVPSLAGNNRHTQPSRARLNLTLHQQRQQELALDAASPEALERLTAESDRNLLGDLESSGATPHQSPRAGRAALLATLLLLPIAALMAYSTLGRPDLVAQPPDKAMADARQAIEGLAGRLKANPDDLEGWVLLGRSLQATQQPGRAATAFEFALKLAPGNPDLMGYLAETLAESNQGSMAGRPAELVLEILQKNPNHKAGLWLAGIAAAEAGDVATARRHWQALRVQLPADSKAAGEIAGFIAKLDAESSPTSENSPAPTPAAAGGGKRLQVKVTLSDSLKEQASPEDTVFVFVRAAEGPPMPLAVVKKQVKDLPLEVELNDAMSMMPGMNLSSFDRLVIGARVSKSGRPVPSPGDLEGLTEPVSPAKEASYSVTISRIIPASGR